MTKDREETWSRDSVLGHRIWDRYAGSPGVIPMESTLRLSRRITHAGRLPLLADVQRRWASAGEIWPLGESSLSYAHHASYAETLLPTPGGNVWASPKPTDVETRLPRTRAAVSSASGGGQPVQRAVASPGSVGGGSPEEKGVSPPRASDLDAAAGVEPAVPAASVGRGDLGPAIVQRYRSTPVGRTAQTKVIESGPMRLSEPIGPSPEEVAPVQKVDAGPGQVQRADTEPSSVADPLPARRPSSHPLDGPESPGMAAESAAAEPAVPAAGVGDLGPAIVQRYRSTPVRQAAQTRVASPEAATLSKMVEPPPGQTVPVQRADAKSASVADPLPTRQPSSHPLGSSESPGMATESATAEPAASAAGVGDLGPAIVQRYRSTPVRQATQTRVASPEAATLSKVAEPPSGQTVQVQRLGPESVNTVGRSLAEPPTAKQPVIKRSLDPTAESKPPGADGESVIPAVGGDLGPAIVQRYRGAPVGPVVQTQITSPGATTLSRPTEPSPERAAQQRSGFGPADTVGRSLARPLSVKGSPCPLDGPGLSAATRSSPAAGDDLGTTILQRHLGGPAGRAARREAVGLQRLSVGSVQTLSAPEVRRGTPSPRAVPLAGVAVGRQEMPLARAAGGGSASLVQARPADSGTRTVVVQRAAEDAAATPEAGAPTGEPAPPAEPPSGAEGPDLERLADEVYAIIERRLIIERESRGL